MSKHEIGARINALKADIEVAEAADPVRATSAGTDGAVVIRNPETLRHHTARREELARLEAEYEAAEDEPEADDTSEVDATEITSEVDATEITSEADSRA